MALLATAPACPTPAQDGLRVCRGSCHRCAPSGRPGPTERSRSRNLGTPSAGQCRRAPERRRWLGIGLTGNGSPTAIHPAPTVAPVPSAAMVTPASTLQDVPVSLDLSPEDFAGVPELLDFTLPGSDESYHESRETGCDLRYPSRAYHTGHCIHGTSPQLNRRPEDPRCRNRARIPSRLDAAASYCT